jgi:hypothetical protein
LGGREDEIGIHYLPGYGPNPNPDEYPNCDPKNEMGKRPEKNYSGKLEETARAPPIRYAA